jgi:hypothetical protein
LAWPFLPTMIRSCTDMPSGAAMLTMAMVIWMSARAGVARGMIAQQSYISAYRIEPTSIFVEARNRWGLGPGSVVDDLIRRLDEVAVVALPLAVGSCIRVFASIIARRRR